MEERGLGDLIATVFRKWKTCTVFALVFAVLLGGFQSYRLYSKAMAARSPEALEKYAQQLDEYSKKQGELENSLKMAYDALESEESYANDSARLNIDPNCVYKTTILFAISDIPEEELEKAHFGAYANPTEYVLNRIKSQYTTLWSCIDLGNAFSENFGLSDRFARELLDFSVNDGAMLQIRSMAATEEDSVALAEISYGLICNMTKDISNQVFGHKLEKMIEITRISVDGNLKDEINAENDALNKLRNEIADTETKLAALKAPAAPTGKSGLIFGALKYAVVGGILGAIIGAVWVMFIGMTTGLVMNSVEIENTAGLVFLGSAGKKHSGFTALADTVSGERVWKKREDGLAVIAARLGAPEEGKKKLVIASSLEKPDKKAIEMLAAKLTGAGYSVSCCIDAQHSAAFVAELKKADGLVLAEKVAESKINCILDVVAQADIEGRDILGFATV